ncbi:MAG: archaeosortase/exosortase family protein [Candidatus Dormibacteria bacterium]
MATRASRGGALRETAERNHARRWLEAATPHSQGAAAVILLVVTTLVAYHLTVVTVLDYLRLDTPLAYLPLLPLFAAWAIHWRVRVYAGKPPPIQDRQVDLLVGVPMLLLAALLVTVVPAIWSTYYWTERPDVISLGLFVSAGVVLFFGFNWFWRLRGPLLLLFLMWPAPYLHLMAGVLQAFTDLTNASLATIVERLPLGVTSAGAPGLLQVLPTHGLPVLVSVGTACSGANSALGFALIGSMVLLAAAGRRPAKLAWLAAGMLLTFAVNLLRLVSILGLAASGQPALALGGYHQVIGLVLFMVVVAVMLGVLPRFGLNLPQTAGATQVSPRTPAGAWLPSSRRWRGGLLLFVVFSLGLGLADQDLAAYASFADGTGSPTVSVFGSKSPSDGFSRPIRVTSYPWAQQYFGPHSDFTRWAFTHPQQGVIWADVVRTDDRGSLDAYNLQNCFLFHDYLIATSRRVDLGNGVTGLLLNYRDPRSGARWATVSWAWPVRFQGQTYYERTALTSDLIVNQRQAPDLRPGDGLRGAVLGIWNTVGGSRFASAPPPAYSPADKNLQAVAVSLVARTVTGSGH